MRIGFIAHPVEDDFEFAALKGFPCLEFNFSTDLDAVRRAGEINNWRHKYEVSVSHVGLYGRNYLSDDPAERDQSFQALRRVTDFARAIGAPLVTTGGGLNERLSLEESCRRTLEHFPHAVAYAESQGLKFAFYNCHWTNFIVGPEAWEPVLNALPSVGIKFDPSHPIYDGKDWAAQLAAWGHRVYHTHAKDTLFIGGKPFEDVPAGLGETQWGRFFALLYHHGYSGDVNVEPHSRTWQGERLYSGILLARRHLEQFLAPPGTATKDDIGLKKM
jgi:sugar phosphate isomerase/epimerase